MDLRRIRNHIETAEKQFEVVKADFAEGFETNPAYAIEWKSDKVLEAQARYELSMLFDAKLDDLELESNLNHWAARQATQLGRMVRTNSRSTSMIANLREDHIAKATLELMEMIYTS